MAGNGRLRQRLGREGSSLLRKDPAPGQDVHQVMIFVSNCFATAAGPRLRWFVLRTIVLQNRGVYSSWYCQGCIPDYCASSKAKRLKQLRPGLIEQSRAECEHRLRALTRAAHASLFEPLLNDLFAGRFDSAAADGFALISLPLRHVSPCASAADPTSSPARTADRLPPLTSHLHVATAATLASQPSTHAVAAPLCMPSHQMSPADALPPHAHISANISSAPRTNFAFGSSRFIARSLGFSHPILPVYPLSPSLNIGMHPPPPTPLRLPTIVSTL